MTAETNLLWNHQHAGVWQGERTLIDSANLVSNLLDKVYPVGSIYMSAVNVSPASFLGGTWQAIEQGRMLMAAGSSWQAGTTGGAAYHTLTVAEMPAHDHSATETAAGEHTHGASTGSAGAHSHTGSTNNAGNHYHTGTTDGAGSHSHTRGSMNITGSFSGVGDDGAEPSYSGAFYKTGERTVRVSNSGNPDYVTGFDASRSWTGSTSTNGSHSHDFSTSWSGEHSHSLSIASAGAHTHSVAIAAAGAHTHAITIGKTGSGAAFSILPPYVAVYMWRRTA
jgi:microcystin-dependent protein